MEGTSSKDDKFITDECKDKKMKDSGSNDDYEALMAALNANREWLQAKVSLNNALVTEGDSHQSPQQPSDLLSVGECESQDDGKQMPLVLMTPSTADKDPGGRGDAVHAVDAELPGGDGVGAGGVTEDGGGGGGTGRQGAPAGTR
jgi:hypothetical protein